MSDFNELCEIYGLSPGDPDSIDKLIYLINEEEMSGDDDFEFIDEEGFEIDEEDLDEE